MMEIKSLLVRPSTLIEGSEYLVNEGNGADSERNLVPVRFVAFCSSPAFVIVQNGKGKVRCAREDVFLLCLEKQDGFV